MKGLGRRIAIHKDRTIADRAAQYLRDRKVVLNRLAKFLRQGVKNVRVGLFINSFVES